MARFKNEVVKLPSSGVKTRKKENKRGNRPRKQYFYYRLYRKKSINWKKQEVFANCFLKFSRVR